MCELAKINNYIVCRREDIYTRLYSKDIKIGAQYIKQDRHIRAHPHAITVSRLIPWNHIHVHILMTTNAKGERTSCTKYSKVAYHVATYAVLHVSGTNWKYAALRTTCELLIILFLDDCLVNFASVPLVLVCTAAWPTHTSNLAKECLKKRSLRLVHDHGKKSRKGERRFEC